MNNFLIIHFNSIFVLLIIAMRSVPTDGQIPDMCSHSARFDSLAQFIYYDLVNLNVAFFFTSKGYYWIINSKEYPSLNNTKGRLPHGFRGDASFSREWKRCEDGKIAPMIVVVDANQKDIRYMIYFIHNSTWTQPYNVSEDAALSTIELYDGLKTVDTILNFANIDPNRAVIDPFYGKLGDESIFIISTAQNNSIYYEFVQLTGCLESNGTFKFKGQGIHYFRGLLEQGLWKMNKSIDAAMVYTVYPNAKPNEPLIEADISLFQENTHYMFTVPLKSVENGVLYCNKKDLIAQYYSTWMGCAEGLTPEPPLYITFTTQIPNTGNGSEDPNPAISLDFQNTTAKWRPTLEKRANPVHDHDDADDSILKVTLISASMVIIVVIVLIVIIVYMFVFNKDKDKD